MFMKKKEITSTKRGKKFSIKC